MILHSKLAVYVVVKCPGVQNVIFQTIARSAKVTIMHQEMQFVLFVDLICCLAVVNLSITVPYVAVIILAKSAKLDSI
jgi:hypothetical protein